MGSVPFGDFLVFRGLGGDALDFGGGGELVASTLVLDGERGELVRAPARVGRKGGSGSVSEVRAALALKSHSEAERRRRERINSHLSRLRTLVPTTAKLDKAALLAEVIKHVKELKSKALEVSRSCHVPSNIDELRVENCEYQTNLGDFLIKASLCCEDRPELITDLKEAMKPLQLKLVSAEISTVGGRVSTVFVMTCEGETKETERDQITSLVYQKFKTILDQVSVQPSFSPRSSLSGKRRRIMPFESSSISSL